MITVFDNELPELRSPRLVVTKKERKLEVFDGDKLVKTSYGPLELVENAIAALAPAQRQVITLRDVEGWSSEEVCNVLGISETNQRVLLHRARAKVRAALEHHFDPDFQ